MAPPLIRRYALPTTLRAIALRFFIAADTRLLADDAHATLAATPSTEHNLPRRATRCQRSAILRLMNVAENEE